jgi:SNF2 family DNA or RNA helicase
MSANMSDPLFPSGKEVRLKSERDRLGVIMGIPRLLAGEFWYRVNFGGGIIENHPESNLEVYDGERNINDLLINGVYGNRETLSKLITFTKIRSPLRKNIYSFKASRTEFHEYQFKPVLKFIDSQDHRLLIADEVGLGKTIEAGYILQEQKARYDMERVLIICPAALVEKWRQELAAKFNEEFDILRTSDIREFLNKIAERGEATKLRGICSLQTLRGRGILEDWEAASPPLDMVIIDEGHHMRNPGTLNHRLGLALSETADSMLMLTATPVHLGNQDLFFLLRILAGFGGHHTKLFFLFAFGT